MASLAVKNEMFANVSILACDVDKKDLQKCTIKIEHKKQ